MNPDAMLRNSGSLSEQERKPSQHHDVQSMDVSLRDFLRLSGLYSL